MKDGSNQRCLSACCMIPLCCLTAQLFVAKFVRREWSLVASNSGGHTILNIGASVMMFFFCQGLSKFAQTAHMFIHGLARFTNAWIGFGTMLQKIGYNSLLSWCLTSKISSLQALNSYHYRFVGFNIPKLYLPNLSRQPYWWNRWAFFWDPLSSWLLYLHIYFPLLWWNPPVFMVLPWFFYCDHGWSRDGRRLRRHAAAAVHGHGSDPWDIERAMFERMTGDASGNLMRFLGN